MKKCCVSERLSTYLDGEAKDAAEVCAHLRNCPACAARLEELRDLGKALRGLPGPLEDPCFVARVTAQAEMDATPRRWHRTVLLAVGMAAIVGASVLVWDTAARRTPAEEQPVLAQAVDWSDDEVLVAELARLLEDGVNLSLLEVGLSGAGEYPVPLTAEESFGALAAATSEAYASSDPAAHAEAEVLLEVLTDAEQAAMQALLSASQLEEIEP
jgi:anti-sigma factor RsiW